jgi:hypothetical protein
MHPAVIFEAILCMKNIQKEHWFRMSWYRHLKMDGGRQEGQQE